MKRSPTPRATEGRLATLLGATVLLLSAATPISAGLAADEAAPACPPAGTWIDPQSGESMTTDQVLRAMSERSIVLLGERHDRVEDHRWQLHALAGLEAHRPVVVGFEMFPRAVQSALDRWSAGSTTEVEFLHESRWREAWGYNPDLYLPLFHFARQNRVPMVALNVERSLVARVGEEGWRAVPEDAREGLSDPAAASVAYRRALAAIYAEKLRRGVGDSPGHGETDQQGVALDTILESPDFERFVEAQLTWDRAMAEALFAASKDNAGSLVVGILGRGHIEHGYGVPHQLADLGESSVGILLPVDADSHCAGLDPGVADAVFVLPADKVAQDRPAPPRLGVMIEQSEGNVAVQHVIEDSVAAASGIKAGDVILTAAAVPVERVADLIEIIERQAPGTWLPLELSRDGQLLELVAKFPARIE